jgi:cytochrome b involved in lipid metabolism
LHGGEEKKIMTLSMSDALKPFVDGLLESYTKTGIINNVDGANLPSKAGVAQITEDLLHLLLPGFFEGTPWRCRA